MKIHMTTGTMDFMENIKKKHTNENILLMNGAGQTLLLHETNGASVFQTPRSYEVVGSSGDLTEPGFFAMDVVAVTDEGKPIFEHQYKHMGEKLQNMPGFIAYRLLRPMASDTYVLISEWTDKRLYEIWHKSPGNKLSKNMDFKDAGGAALHIFTSAPYTTHYKTPSDEI